MVETGRIIVFYEYDGSENFPYSQVYIFEVKSDKEIVLPMLDLTYKKLQCKLLNPPLFGEGIFLLTQRRQQI